MVDLVKENISLKPYNSWKVGGEAKYFAQPANKDELSKVYSWALEKDIPIYVLGGGTNILVSDLGFDGLVIHTANMKNLSEVDASDSYIQFSAQSGASKSEVLKIFMKHKLDAAIFLTGLPGDVGGGVVMNAGVGTNTQPKEFNEIVEWIEVLKPNLDFVRYTHDQLNWQYRKSLNWQPGIITEVGFKYKNTPSADFMQKMREATKRRISTQPINKPSGGSTFKNPEGYTSGALIDGLGLKGYKIGGAEVSTKHANFLVTDETASANDLWELIRFIKVKVKEAHDIELHTEVQLIGQFD